MTTTLVGIPKLFKCVVLVHVCHQNEIVFLELFPTKVLLSKPQMWMDGKWSSMAFFLQRPEKEVSSKLFPLGWDSTQETWNMAVYWSFGKNFNILSIRWCKQRLAVKQILWVRKFLWVSSRRDAFIFNKLPEHEYLHWTDFFSIRRHSICRLMLPHTDRKASLLSCSLG